jgi:hypothetical protein
VTSFGEPVNVGKRRRRRWLHRRSSVEVDGLAFDDDVARRRDLGLALFRDEIELARGDAELAFDLEVDVLVEDAGPPALSPRGRCRRAAGRPSR